LAITPVLSGGIAASGTGGTDLTGGRGFFVGMTAGLTLGMPEEYAPLDAGNKGCRSGRIFLYASTAPDTHPRLERLTFLN
jgi:hypothetical protein